MDSDSISSDHPDICDVCEAPAYNMCKGCELSVYCSKKCQTLDWTINNHQEICYIECPSKSAYDDEDEEEKDDDDELIEAGFFRRMRDRRYRRANRRDRRANRRDRRANRRDRRKERKAMRRERWSNMFRRKKEEN